MAYDAIICGSRIAGSSTAMLLARRGYRVLMVDRASFPSDTISTHIVWQHGVNRLIEWGIGDGLQRLGAPALNHLIFDTGEVLLEAPLPGVGRAQYAYAPRRTRLDKMLFDAAVAAGVEVREGVTVEDVLFENRRATGIRGRDRAGRPFSEDARVIIGADGVHSTIARAVEPAEYDTHPKLTCWYYTYWTGVRNDCLRLYSRPFNAIGVIPTNEGAVCVAIGWPNPRFAEVKTDIEGHFLRTLDTVPELKQELLSGRREERFYGTGHIPNYKRKPYGEGWALVGDAGYHKDPILAQGISDALRDSALLTSAIDDAFCGREEWGTALGAYETARNSAVDAIYGLNSDFARLAPPPPEMRALTAALENNVADTAQFFGTMTGAVPVSDFYAPDNTRRILEAAPRLVAAGAD